MGYSTDFEGRFTVTPPLSEAQRAYLTAFSETRRMARDDRKTEARPDPLREAVGLPVGLGGGYFVGETVPSWPDRSDDVTNYNDPPSGQPGLWCQWVPNRDGTAILWNEGEKFYNYIGWLEYLIEHFIKPWGRRLDGEVSWEGEERGDLGIIVVDGNKVTIKYGRILYG
jgi:hypothetical protein